MTAVIVVTTVTARIMDLRKRARLSARAVDRLARLGEGVAAKLERRAGHGLNLQAETIVALCTLYGCSADWLLFGQGIAPDEEDLTRSIASAERARGNRFGGR